MPTGYTSDLYEGKKVPFEKFLLTCARAFGALIEMRDEDLDATIPDKFEPSRYHADRIRESKRALAIAETMTREQAEKAASSKFEKEMRRYEKAMAERGERYVRYTDMLTKAKSWEPPTKDHVRLKEFMIQQLQDSIESDCYTPERPKKETVTRYKVESIRSAKRDIEYNTAELKKEIERAAERTAWVKALRDSLGGKVVV